MRKGIFLDRDGVLNDARVVDGAARSPRTLDDFRILDSAMAALDRLKSAGYTLVVITNQPDVGRGLIARATLDEMHSRLLTLSGIDRIEVCPHSGHENCDCRKPKPGMLLRAAAAMQIDLLNAWTVGDRWVDVAAGAAAGTHTALVERSYSYLPTSTGLLPTTIQPDIVGLGLSDIADEILRRDTCAD